MDTTTGKGMRAKRKAMAMAKLETIRTHGAAYQHTADDARVAAIVARVAASGVWDLPPVLVLEGEMGDGPTILDGHHRYTAANRIMWHSGAPEGCPVVEEIPAWVVSVEEYAKIVEEHFGGGEPAHLSDLDDYIDCGGTSYANLGLRADAPLDAPPEAR